MKTEYGEGDTIHPVFEEWGAYAVKKALKPRNLNLDRVTAEAKLKIVAITGIRRCGKSSMLILLHQKLLREGRPAAYLNLEDSRIKDTPALLDEVIKWFGDAGFLLLDEITAASDWEGWLARTHEMLKGDLYLIVGSSRGTLAKPSKPLRGRMLAHELYPLSFSEFLRFKAVRVEPTTAGIGRLEKALREYLVYGGFPEVVLAPDFTDKIKLLHSYFRDIIGLDVADMADSSIATVELFGKYLIEAPYFSASKALRFFQQLGHKIGKASLLHLEKCSQDGYLFFFVPIFSRTVKDRTQYPRKVYVGDTGFLYAMSGRTDWGRLCENAVFLELKRRLSPQQGLYYWKNPDGAETDFVIHEGLRVREILQVSYVIEKAAMKPRELEGLVAGAQAFGLKSGRLLTWNVEGSETREGIRVRYQPLWKWLLEEDR